jgi:hypothetical protein
LLYATNNPEQQDCDEEVEVNKSRLIGGIICLALAGLLAVLNWRLPADKLMFMVGGINVPMIILAIVGLLLLITAGKR